MFTWLDYVYESWEAGDLEDVALITEKYISVFDGKGRLWSQLFEADTTLGTLSRAAWIRDLEDDDGFMVYTWDGTGEAFEMYFGPWREDDTLKMQNELFTALERPHP